MQNEVQRGDNIDYLASALVSANTIAGSLVVSGDAVVIGDLVGVSASTAALSTDLIAVSHKGVFNLPVFGHNAGGNGALAAGARVYIDPATGIISADSTKVHFGWALFPINSGATTVGPVKLKH